MMNVPRVQQSVAVIPSKTIRRVDSKYAENIHHDVYMKQNQHMTISHILNPTAHMYIS